MHSDAVNLLTHRILVCSPKRLSTSVSKKNMCIDGWGEPKAKPPKPLLDDEEPSGGTRMRVEGEENRETRTTTTVPIRRADDHPASFLPAPSNGLQ
jgi:hypothetical protein